MRSSWDRLEQTSGFHESRVEIAVSIVARWHIAQICVYSCYISLGSFAEDTILVYGFSGAVCL